MKINKISLKALAYPEILRNIPSPPKELYVQGPLEDLLCQPRLAVVGSRKVTAYGRGVTHKLSSASAQAGVVIISGLALGVDSIAHEAALESGGKTIAVLPCGLDKPYPAQHRQLAGKILNMGGAIVSEYPEGTPPLVQHFIARNRLVSGLSDGVLITEAAARSGTLHTANFALNQGRTVMAVPGNITSPYSMGTNNLIKSGALPVTCPEDIFSALNLIVKPVAERELLGSNREETLLLSLLTEGTTEAAELLTQSGLEAGAFNQTLTMLEINGHIRPLGAGHWTLL
ncbi:hypothetical protein BH23PAT1_BH23PAT1_1560 [soil metagenome]